MKRSLAATTPSDVSAPLLLILAIGFMIGWVNQGCVRRSRQIVETLTTNEQTNRPQDPALARIETSNQQSARININTASSGDLEKLPGIGKGLATRIIEHREQFGPFRKPEHLIIVRGISDKRFRALQEFVTVQ